jgi:hypothetical protein
MNKLLPEHPRQVGVEAAALRFGSVSSAEAKTRKDSSDLKKQIKLFRF